MSNHKELTGINSRTSLKTTMNQDLISKGNSSLLNHRIQENSLLDSELNNALIYNNNINYLNKNQQDVLNNDMKYNAPKKDKFVISKIDTQKIERDKSKELNFGKECLTPKLDKFSKVSTLSDNSPQIAEKIKHPTNNDQIKEKNKLFELNNNQITHNFTSSNNNSTQNSSRIGKNQYSFQKKQLKKN